METNGWYLLTELALSEFIPGEARSEPRIAGYLLPAVRELGMPAAWVENVEKTLAAFVKEAQVHFKPGSLEPAGWIRVFCQIKILEEGNFKLRKARPFFEDRALEDAQMIPDSSTKRNGGWGYYVIERGIGCSGFPGKESGHIIELYIYKEG